MRTPFIPLSSVLFLGILAACENSTEPAAPGGPSWMAVVSRENFTTEIEATFDCTAAGGEIIDVSGTLHVTARTIQGKDFFYAIVTSNAQGITGTGRSTGATYQAPGMGLSTFQERFDPTSGEFTFLDLTHLVRTGPGGDGTLWGAKIINHLTVTATGQLIDHSVDASDCVAL